MTEKNNYRIRVNKFELETLVKITESKSELYKSDQINNSEYILTFDTIEKVDELDELVKEQLVFQGFDRNYILRESCLSLLEPKYILRESRLSLLEPNYILRESRLGLLESKYIPGESGLNLFISDYIFKEYCLIISIQSKCERNRSFFRERFL